MRIIDDLKYRRRWKKAEQFYPKLVREHNSVLLQAYDPFSRADFRECLGLAVPWIDNRPGPRQEEEIARRQRMTDHELFSYFSNEYKDTGRISEAEKARIRRLAATRDVSGIFNGSGPMFLMVAIAYGRLGDHENALRWKYHAARLSANYYTHHLELDLALQLSQIDDLLRIGRYQEAVGIRQACSVERLRKRFTPDKYSTAVLDMLGSRSKFPSEELEMFWDQKAEFERDFESKTSVMLDDATERFEIIRPDGWPEIRGGYGLSGLTEILQSEISVVRKDPSAESGDFSVSMVELWYLP